MRQLPTAYNEKLVCKWIALPVIAAMLAGAGCSANSNPKTVTAEKKTVATSASSDPGINLDCVYSHLQNPPESFHYVYKKDASGAPSVDQEADVTPQMIDGFRKKPDGTPQPVHGVRSDPQSWQTALASLTGISGMASAIALIHNNDAQRRETDGGPLNGYQTIHYSIDTSRWDAITSKMLGGTIGPGGFEKGDAWVTAEGCPVKLVLDSEMHKHDRSLLEKVHYEEAMIKK